MCRAPNPDTVLVIQTPTGVFSTKSLLQSQVKQTGSRRISMTRTEVPRDPTLETHQFESLSAARCRTYRKMANKVKKNNILTLYIHLHWIRLLWWWWRVNLVYAIKRKFLFSRILANHLLIFNPVISMVVYLWNTCVVRDPLTSYLKNEEKLREWLKWVIIKFIVLCSSLAALYVSASSFCMAVLYCKCPYHCHWCKIILY